MVNVSSYQLTHSHNTFLEEVADDDNDDSGGDGDGDDDGSGGGGGVMVVVLYLLIRKLRAIRSNKVSKAKDGS